MKLSRVASLATIVILLASASLYKARPQSKPLAFEVASIKPNARGDHRSTMQTTPGGRLNVTGATLRILIRNAYRIEDFQILGGPAWMSSDQFDIQAKAEENATPEQVNEMLQTLLAERFQLKFHKETRQLTVYELGVAKNGPKLEETKPNAEGSAHASHAAGGHGPAAGGGSHINAAGTTMKQLATMLGNTLGRTVIDKTGLTGSYDIKLAWSPDPGERPAFSGVPHGGSGAGAPRPADQGLPSLFKAVQEQLGLKIESGKGPVEVLVIERAAKPAEQQ